MLQERILRTWTDALPCLKCSGHKYPFASYLRIEFRVERVQEAGDMSREYPSHYSPARAIVHIFDSLLETAYYVKQLEF